MADSLVVGTRRDGTITITDGAAATYTVAFEVGDFSASEPLADRVVIRDRGAIVGLRIVTGKLSAICHLCYVS